MELDGHPVTAAELAPLALHGYGHFTTMQVADLRVRGLGHHMDRLSRDCRALFGSELDPGYVRHLARRVAAAAAAPVTVRVTVFDPDLDMGRPAAEGRPRVLVTSRPAGGPAAALTLRTTEYERHRPEVKSTAVFGSLERRRAAQREGADDALFLDRDLRISEGPTWNIGFIRDGGVVWPEAAVLPGVTMLVLREVLEPSGIASGREPLSPADAAGMAAAFVTNATTGPRPVVRVDGTEYPAAHPLLGLMRERYRALPGEEL